MTIETTGDPLAPRRRRGGLVRLTPDTVRNLEFPRTPLGRRGYAEAEVERFRARVVDEITRSDAEKAELREEVDRLRTFFRQRVSKPNQSANGHSTNGSGGPPAERDDNLPTVQAVNVLSTAQQAADAHIAQAQDYARRLVADARARYEQILAHAHQQAEAAAAQAARDYQARYEAENGARHHENAELEARIAYLRTFAHVTQVQLKSTLQALSHELDRFNEDPAELPEVEVFRGVSADLVGQPRR